MTSINLKQVAAFAGTAALVLAGIIMVLGSGLPARAQSEEARFSSRLAGTWRLQITVQDCETGAALRTFPALAAFSKAGTLTPDHRRPAPLAKHYRSRRVAAH